jgi:hypothetical protein
MIVLQDAAEGYVHVADVDNSLANWTTCDAASLVGDETALCFESHLWNPGGLGGVYNNYRTGVWYTSTAWAIYNENSANHVAGAAYNVMVPGNNMRAWTSGVTAESTTLLASYHRLDHPALNNRHDAIVLWEHNWNPNNVGGTYNDHNVGIWYNSEDGYWYLYNMDAMDFVVSDNFNIVFGFPQPANDDCVNATSIDNLFHQEEGVAYSSSVFSNDGAVTNSSDPMVDENCWFDGDVVDNSVWFTFEGDGNAYNVLTTNCSGSLSDTYIEQGDTQIAVFIGVCNEVFALVACNDDSEDSSTDNLFSEVEFDTEVGVTYYILVDGYSAGDGVPADGEFCIQVTQVGAVGVGESAAQELKLYPNPAQTQIRIEGSVEMNQIQIFNAMGMRVMDIQGLSAAQMNLDVQELASGMYTLRASTGSKVQTMSFIKE